MNAGAAYAIRDPELTRGLESVRDTEADGYQCRLGARMLNRLVDAGLIYVAVTEPRDGSPVRCYAHLTRRGALALGIEPGNRQ